tara:strand:+ start:1002 stop:1955 length:954 start_codon:yes stop_codon:yes gene_type:complete
MSHIVSVTDHIKDFEIEKNILGDYFNSNLSTKTTIILVWHKEINEAFLKKYPSVRAVVRYGVGYDNIDLEFCKKNKIIVANTPDYGVDEVSDTAIAMILYLTRKIGTLENLALEDSNYWIGKNLNLKMKRLNTLSLGIIGLGRIGGSIAKKFSQFTKNIGFYDPYLPNGYEKIFGIDRYNDLSKLLQISDIVSVNTPLNKDTRGMINENFLNQMKKGSYLVNLSRGPIVQDKNIILKKLLNYELEGYGTDVWIKEPPIENDQLYSKWKEKEKNLIGRIIVNPHTSYFSEESIYESRSKACKTCLDIINGVAINNRII